MRRVECLRCCLSDVLDEALVLLSTAVVEDCRQSLDAEIPNPVLADFQNLAYKVVQLLLRLHLWLVQLVVEDDTLDDDTAVVTTVVPCKSNAD